jgi:hypothetical protein
MNGMHQDGWVSIWVFLKSEITGEDILTDIFSINDYDLDTQDVVGDEDWKVLSVEELIGRLSYSASFAPEAVQQSRSRGIVAGRRALAQYDLRYEPSQAPPPTGDDPVFVASVPYQRT